MADMKINLGEIIGSLTKNLSEHAGDYLDASSVKRLGILAGAVPVLNQFGVDPKVAMSGGLVYAGLSYLREMVGDWKEVQLAKADVAGKVAAAAVSTPQKANDLILGIAPPQTAAESGS